MKRTHCTVAVYDVYRKWFTCCCKVWVSFPPGYRKSQSTLKSRRRLLWDKSLSYWYRNKRLSWTQIHRVVNRKETTSLSKWSNYPNSILFGYLGDLANFFGYFINIDFFLNIVILFYVWQWLDFCFDKSTKLNIAKLLQKNTSEKKFYVHEVSKKIWLSPPSIQIVSDR